MHRKMADKRKKVYLFCDEFTNYNDTEIGIKAILLLEKLGYEVIFLIMWKAAGHGFQRDWSESKKDCQ